MLTRVNPQLLFQGRPGDVRFGQWVETQIPSSFEPLTLALFGCPDDQGIRINRGRPGASLGPDEIRKAFYKIALPTELGFEKIRLVDAGNIEISSTISETHQRAFEAAKELAKKASCVILLGGGHDFAAPGFLGTQEGWLSQSKQAKWGLINIDPHLDVREYEKNKNHSGSSFRNILDSEKIDPKLLIEFGCRKNRNADSHFSYCRQKRVSLLPLEDIHSSSKSVSKIFSETLKRLTKEVSHLAVSLDMDSCYEISGTSAPAAIGFKIRELVDIAYQVGRESKTCYFEIAEVSPPLDPSQKTPLVAAEILYAFLCGKAHHLSLENQHFSKRKKSKTIKNPKK